MTSVNRYWQNWLNSNKRDIKRDICERDILVGDIGYQGHFMLGHGKRDILVITRSKDVDLLLTERDLDCNQSYFNSLEVREKARYKYR